MKLDNQKKLKKSLKASLTKKLKKRRFLAIKKSQKQRLKQELSSCNPLRNLKMKSKMIFRKALAVVTIIAVIITTYLQFTPQGQAATN